MLLFTDLQDNISGTSMFHDSLSEAWDDSMQLMNLVRNSIVYCAGDLEYNPLSREYCLCGHKIPHGYLPMCVHEGKTRIDKVGHILNMPFGDIGWNCTI
jgi:hypothetical protein